MTTETKPLTHAQVELALDIAAHELTLDKKPNAAEAVDGVKAAWLALFAERDAALREADRLRHGVPVEGDFVCPNELRVTEAEAERDEALALLADLVPWSDAWRLLGEQQYGPMPDMTARIAEARALLAKTEGRR